MKVRSNTGCLQAPRLFFLGLKPKMNIMLNPGTNTGIRFILTSRWILLMPFVLRDRSRDNPLILASPFSRSLHILYCALLVCLSTKVLLFIDTLLVNKQAD